VSAPAKTSSPITPVLLPATMHALLGATLLAAMLHSLAIAFHWGGPSWTLARNDLLNLPVGLLATLLCWLVGSQLESQQRIAWRYFAAGMASFLIGDLIWTFLEMVLKLPPLPSVAGVFYLGLPILFLFALRTLTGGIQNRLETLKISLDAALILIATLIVVWQVFLAQLVVTFSQNLLGLVFGTAMPILELMVVVCLMLPSLGRQNAQPGPHFGLLWIGMVLLLFGNTNLIFEGMRQTYQVNQPARLFCTWAFVLFAVAAHAKLHFRLPAQQFSRNGQFGQLTSLFPHTAALVGMIALGQQFGRKDLTALGVLIGNGLLGLLVMVRQAVSLYENGRLNAQLLELNAGLTEQVTDREIALEQSKERLIAADRLASLGQLTGGIAHEVNTPLAAAMNFLHQANNLSEEYQNSISAPGVTNADHLEIANELKGNISSAQTTLERLGEFVRSIRNQGRSLGAGSTSYNLVSVVRDTVNMLEFEARKVQVHVQFESSSETVMIHGEPGRIAQIVQNLVGNAIHACESRRAPGGSVVTVHLGRQLTGQTQGMGVPVLSERIVLAVQDNGSGIPPEVLPRIFEPLYSTKEIGRGTGLGLSIIRDIVTGHLGGEINLETSIGQGTTFTVRFPVAHAPQIELAVPRNFEPSRNTVVIGDD
jgi:signal transduction histidine kinase